MDDFLSKPLSQKNLESAQSPHVAPLPPSGLEILKPWNGVDAEVLPKLAELMIQNSTEQLAELERAFEALDERVLAKVSHTLRGSLGLFGARRAVNVVIQLEKAAAEKNWPSVRSHINNLAPELASVHAEILTRLASGTAATSLTGS